MDDIIELEWRDAQYNEHGTIDCEINHPHFGWIPFTAMPDDEEDHGRQLFEAMKNVADPYVPPPPPPPPTLEEKKQAKAIAARSLRDEKETLGFTYLGHRWDSDERSVTRIYGAVQAAQLAQSGGQPFEIEWATQDGFLELDAAGMIGAPAALATHVNALHMHYRSLKTQIEAAASKSELDAIDTENGWPE